MPTGLVFNIQRYCIHDGPGIRTTVFLKGCPLRCWWCHNPESHAAEPELSVIEARCVRCGLCTTVCPQQSEPGQAGGPMARCTRCGACVEACPTGARQMIGRSMRVDEVLAEILKDRVFYEDSGGGATFSGGEPLAQPGFLAALLRGCRAAGVAAAVDTCGFAPRDDLMRLAPLADLFLYDVKLADDALHRRHTGVSNRVILGNLRALGRVHGNIWIRVPVIPGVNDTDAEMQAIARLVGEVPGVRRVSLLPYHGTGRHKRKRTADGRPPRGAASPAATPQPVTLQEAAEQFRRLGLSTQIGG